MKPAFQEERRFCFELKTKDTTILLQAETQADLTAWISVFEQAKRTAVNSSSSMAVQASSIIPPSAPPPEVSVKDHPHDENISMGFDRALTLPLSGAPPEKGSSGLGARNIDGIGRKDRSSPSTPTSAIGVLMSATHSTFPIPISPLLHGGSSDQSTDSNIHTKISLAPNTLVAPSPHSLMKSATMAAALSSPKVKEQVDFQKQIVRTRHKKSVSLDMDVARERQSLQRPPIAPSISEDEIYPPNYPSELRAQDTQFRAFFPGEPLMSPVLLVFLGAWNFTDKQEIAGRFYVTHKTLYFYAHFLGLVYTKVIPLHTIEGVRLSTGKYSDHIVFHLRPKDPDDSDYEDETRDENALKIFVKIFLEPVRLLQSRLNLLLENETAQLSLKQTAEVLDRLVELEADLGHHAPDGQGLSGITAGSVDGYGEPKRVFALQRPPDKPRKELALTGLENPYILCAIKLISDLDNTLRIKYPSEPVTFVPVGMDKMALEREFDIPAKALFHIMFGDRSVVFQRLYQERRAQGDTSRQPQLNCINDF